MSKRLLRLSGVRAKFSGRSSSSIWGDVKAGRLPKPIKIGGICFWPEDEIDQVIERALAERESA